MFPIFSSQSLLLSSQFPTSAHPSSTKALKALLLSANSHRTIGQVQICKYSTMRQCNAMCGNNKGKSSPPHPYNPTVSRLSLHPSQPFPSRPPLSQMLCPLCIPTERVIGRWCLDNLRHLIIVIIVTLLRFHKKKVAKSLMSYKKIMSED